jgi:hypothetical protein
MKIERAVNRTVRTLLAALLACVALAAPAQAQTSATITPSFSPDRPGAKAALTFTIQYTGGEFGIPSPVHKSVMLFPAGLTLDLPSLRSCTAARLLAHGPSSCPAQSKIGRGHALAETTAGAQLITEEVNVWAFIGPPQNNEPTLELLGEGTTPVPGQVVVTGTVLPAHAPYGEELVIPIPPVPTLPSEPDVSMVNLSLTIGASPRHRPRNANTVLVPARCPTGGFPFAAEFTYADGSTGSAFATAPCTAKASG